MPSNAEAIYGYKDICHSSRVLGLNDAIVHERNEFIENAKELGAAVVNPPQ